MIPIPTAETIGSTVTTAAMPAAATTKGGRLAAGLTATQGKRVGSRGAQPTAKTEASGASRFIIKPSTPPAFSWHSMTLRGMPRPP